VHYVKTKLKYFRALNTCMSYKKKKKINTSYEPNYFYYITYVTINEKYLVNELILTYI